MSELSPLVSVYIPSYKAADTLEKAVDSALSQMENLEVVIVDDCSPDDTFAVAKKLAAKDARVRVFQLEKNSGVSTARNFAMQQSCGKWLAALDGDDWFAEGRLAKLIAAAEENGAEMAADNQFFFDIKAGQVAGTAFPDNGKISTIDLGEFLAASNATKSFDYGMLKPVIRADFIRKNKLEYYPPARMGQDYYFLLEFFAAGGKAAITDTPLYYYVQPFGSISKQPQKDGRKHYNHELQKTINQHFLELFSSKFSAAQLAHLHRRGREIDALISFYNLRETLKKKDLKTAFCAACKANFEFWKFITQRILQRLRKIFG